MLKSEDVVTLMQQNFNDIVFLSTQPDDFKVFLQSQPHEPFSEDSVNFLNALSIELQKEPKLREFPDVATFGFFCRKANILGLKKKFAKEDTLRFGRGIVFHIAPSNVPVNFAYSLLCGVLSGNVNIVRVPSKDFDQVAIICNAIKRLEVFHKKVTERIVLVKYDRQNSATSYFSSMADVRIIWGGDETIDQIRKNPLPPRSFDVTFADRYSLCLINADAYSKEDNLEKIAQAFYNDTYLFDQNACTAPHLVVWTGNEQNIIKSKELFWNKLYEVVKQKYTLQPVIAIDKLTSFFTQAAKTEGTKKSTTKDNLIWRIQLKSLPNNVDDFRCSSGYFSEYTVTDLSELSLIIKRNYQTLSYYGFEKEVFYSFMKKYKPLGIDRIVPIGKTTDFSLIWDGYELISTLTRICDIT